MNLLPKLSGLSPDLVVTPTEKVAFRCGAAMLSGFSLLALLPLVFFVSSVLDLSGMSSLEMGLVIGTWLAFAYTVLALALCEYHPTPRAYIAVIFSCAATFLLWVGWGAFAFERLN